MRFNAGFWLEEKAFGLESETPMFRRMSELVSWIELNNDPLELATAWDAKEEPPGLFSRKFWLQQEEEW